MSALLFNIITFVVLVGVARAISAVAVD